MIEVINIHDKNRGASLKRNASLFFYGDEGNPFLAPRGWHTIDGKFIVANTAQSRIFLWNKIPQTPYQKPDVFFEQTLLTDTQRNAGGEIDAGGTTG